MCASSSHTRVITIPDWRKLLMQILVADLAFLLADVLLLVFGAMLFQADLLALVKGGFFSTVLLVEAAVVFIIGGLIPISSSLFASNVRRHVFRSDEQWSVEKHRKSEEKANVFIVVGVVLFLESLVTSILIV